MKLFEFFEKHYRIFDHWIEFDTVRILYEIERLDDVVELNEKSLHDKRDVRNFLLFKIGTVKTDVLWSFDRIPVTRQLYQWLISLKEITAEQDKNSYECFVLMCLYCIYIVELNLKYFVSNFPSFVNLARFYNLMNTMNLIKLRNADIIMFFHLYTSTPYASVSFEHEDDIIQAILERRDEIMHNSRCRIPNFDEISTLATLMYTMSKQKEGLSSRYRTRQPKRGNRSSKCGNNNQLIDELAAYTSIIMSYPRLVLNSILLMFFKTKEVKMKSTFFRDMITICKDVNTATIHEGEILGVKRKGLLLENKNDEVSEDE